MPYSCQRLKQCTHVRINRTTPATSIRPQLSGDLAQFKSDVKDIQSGCVVENQNSSLEFHSNYSTLISVSYVYVSTLTLVILYGLDIVLPSALEYSRYCALVLRTILLTCMLSCLWYLCITCLHHEMHLILSKFILAFVFAGFMSHFDVRNLFASTSNFWHDRDISCFYSGENDVAYYDRCKRGTHNTTKSRYVFPPLTM